METLKHKWKRLPTTIRKPIVLVVGMLLVIIAPFTGVLPGPGGIPIFLVGVAILSTEFEWAKRLRDWTLQQVHRASQTWRRHKVAGTAIIIVCAALFGLLSFLSFRYAKSHF